MDGHPAPRGADRIPPTGRLTVTTCRQHQASWEHRGRTASTWVTTVWPFRTGTAGVVAGPGPDAHASTQAMRNVRLPTGPDADQPLREFQSIGTARRRLAARQIRTESTARDRSGS